MIVRWLGLVDYEPTFRAMQKFVDERDGASRDEIWLLEHSPVFTLGMAGDRAHLLMPGDIPGSQPTAAARSRITGPVSWWPIHCSTCVAWGFPCVVWCCSWSRR